MFAWRLLAFVKTVERKKSKRHRKDNDKNFCFRCVSNSSTSFMCICRPQYTGPRCSTLTPSKRHFLSDKKKTKYFFFFHFSKHMPVRYFHVFKWRLVSIPCAQHCRSSSLIILIVRTFWNNHRRGLFTSDHNDEKSTKCSLVSWNWVESPSVTKTVISKVSDYWTE
jgi:hypothetical protein